MNKNIVNAVVKFDADVEMLRMRGSVKWTHFFESEDAIINALKAIPVVNERALYIGMDVAYKGYEYIHSFAKTVQSGKSLSPAQMRQAKRLASEIKKAYIIKDMW